MKEFYKHIEYYKIPFNYLLLSNELKSIIYSELGTGSSYSRNFNRLVIEININERSNKR